MRRRAPKALLFDLGGVVVDIDFNRALRTWAKHSALPVEELRARFKYDTAYEQHERGQLDSREYFIHLARTLELSATHAEIEQGWNSIFVSEILETRKMIEEHRTKLPCFAFTNTNASHQATWSRLYPAIVQAFDKVFASHELGMRKPEAEAFARICELTEIKPADFLFFDDLPENVQAGMDCGLQSVLVRSPNDVRTALIRIGAAG